MKAMLKCLLLSFVSMLFFTSVTTASSLKDIVDGGTYSGDIGVHGSWQDDKVSDEEFGNAFLYLNVESGDWKGFKVGVGFTVLTELWENNDGDADAVHGELLNLAYINYSAADFSATLGRQEIDLEWIGDYHEAFSLEYTGIKDATITALVTRSIAVADPDEISEKFEKILDSDGDDATGYAVDAKYEGIENVALNGYVFGVTDLFKGYGLKVDYDTEIIGATAHYAGSKEDANGADDGAIFHGELRGAFAGFTVAGGYIWTDKDAGAASLATLGDNISPLEDGNHVYDPDADTYYVAVGYEYDALSLSALYGNTEYSSDDETEINVIAGYEILDDLSLEAIFVDVDAEASTDDYTRYQLMLTFAF